MEEIAETMAKFKTQKKEVSFQRRTEAEHLLKKH